MHTLLFRNTHHCDRLSKYELFYYFLQSFYCQALKTADNKKQKVILRIIKRFVSIKN